jgi:hypothetical protein
MGLPVRHNAMISIRCSKCGKSIRRMVRRKNAACNACNKSRKTAWCEQHREYLRKYDREYYEEHQEERRQQWRAWVNSNRAHHRAVRRKYRKRTDRETRQIAAELDGLCDSCGMTHTQEIRARILRRMLPCSPADIHEAWPCIWGAGGRAGKTGAGPQRLYRDLHRLGAVRLSGTWYPASESRAA